MHHTRVAAIMGNNKLGNIVFTHQFQGLYCQLPLSSMRLGLRLQMSFAFSPVKSVFFSSMRRRSPSVTDTDQLTRFHYSGSPQEFARNLDNDLS